jgi:nicotinamide mononucleotide (NMN) deamidase PncC
MFWLGSGPEGRAGPAGSSEDKPIGSVEIQSIKSKAGVTSGEVRASKRGPRAIAENELRQEMRRP